MTYFATNFPKVAPLVTQFCNSSSRSCVGRARLFARGPGGNYIREMQIARCFAMGVEQAPDGEFVAGKCHEVRSAPSAVRKARSLAHQNGGAIAFGLRGEIEFGRPGSIEFSRAWESCPPGRRVLLQRPDGPIIRSGRSSFPVEVGPHPPHRNQSATPEEPSNQPSDRTRYHP